MGPSWKNFVYCFKWKDSWVFFTAFCQVTNPSYCHFCFIFFKWRGFCLWSKLHAYSCHMCSGPFFPWDSMLYSTLCYNFIPSNFCFTVPFLCYLMFLVIQICRYRLAYSSNYSHMLDPIVENNYQLFMIERLIMMGAKTFIRTFKEDETDLSLTDDPKKNTKKWQIPELVYNADETCWDLHHNLYAIHQCWKIHTCPEKWEGDQFML